MTVQSEKLRDMFVAAVPGLERFESRIQPTLTFVQSAEKQHDGSLGLLHGQLGILQQQTQRSSLAFPMYVLLAAARLLGREVHIGALDTLARYLPSMNQSAQGVLAPDMKRFRQFVRLVSVRRSFDKGLRGCKQVAVSREPYIAAVPEAFFVKGRDGRQRVVSTAMGVAAHIGQGPELAIDGPRARVPQHLAQLVYGRYLVSTQIALDIVREELWCSHNVHITPISLQVKGNFDIAAPRKNRLNTPAIRENQHLLPPESSVKVNTCWSIYFEAAA